MQKRCRCGKDMTMQMRTVIYSGKVEIERVPVFTCESCQYSEIYSGVKPELQGLIRKLGKCPGRQQVFFPEVNELANLFDETARRGEHPSLETLILERTDELLDLFLLARSLNQSTWMREISGRLLQISNFR